MLRLFAVAATAGLLAIGTIALPATASAAPSDRSLPWMLVSDAGEGTLPGSSHPGLGYLGDARPGHLPRSYPSVTSPSPRYRPPVVIDGRPAVIGRPPVIGRTPHGFLERSPGVLVVPPREVPRSHGITGSYCRQTARSGGSRTDYGKACLQPDGSWAEVGG